MPGIYIHIPFCKQACNYCDFHFSTSMKKKEEMVLALAKEIQMRKHELKEESIQTIYFGGGTPSVLTVREINFLISEIYNNYKVDINPEITLEANPDDLSIERLLELSKTQVNRLSIGIQSFYEEDLKLMNRAHTTAQAKESLEIASHYFSSISVDLIYGIPGMSNEKWIQNIEKALSFGVQHISSYALTVEPKTALNKLIQTGKIAAPSDEVAQNHYEILVEILESKGFIQYELSNFAKPNYFSKNNSGYWLGKKYLGIGPSAHSYNGIVRSWNVSNNSVYIQSILKSKLPSEAETLSLTDQYNEYIMTGLRTIWGVSLNRVKIEFGVHYFNYLQERINRFLEDDLLIIEKNILKPTKKGKFLTDGIVSDLFYLNLE